MVEPLTERLLVSNESPPSGEPELLTTTTTTTTSPPPNTSPEEDEPDIRNDQEEGSSIVGVIFNFTNCIVGAGAIGLGGAIAQSGGLISIMSILLFGVLTKRSLDLVIQLSIETPGAHGSYEDLGRVAFGTVGSCTIAASKFLYSFGCLVAYVVVVKDNFAPAVLNLVQNTGHCMGRSHSTGDDTSDWLQGLCYVLENRIATTWVVCIFVMLPLCLLRDMRALSSISAISIASIMAIVFIILYLYADNPYGEIRQNEDIGNVYETWLQVRPGYLECLGTFVFTFVSQHTVHLAFQSLKPKLRTARNWRTVSLVSVGLSALMSLTIGVGVYVSFGKHAKSDIFDIYPQIPLIDVAKLLLSITMVLTFPMPFFTCRELVILNFFPANINTIDEEQDAWNPSMHTSPSMQSMDGDSELPLHSTPPTPPETSSQPINHEPELDEPLLPLDRSTTSELASALSTHAVAALNWVLLPDDPKQLKFPFHVIMTVKLWLVVVGLAIAAPSLGDVLDLVGCATGTMIAFVVPSCLSFRLKGYSLEAALLLLVGGVVGVVGTCYSLKKILEDIGLF